MGASAFGSITALAATPPSPGNVEPSFLYADLQSRSLWLGVDPSVNPLGSVLISDIVQTQADIIAAEVNAKAYTDVQITTRAPVVHTHMAADISDFTAAVDAAVADNIEINWVTGMIMLWSGVLSSIGVGALAGWALCDGSNGTPDLRDRFIIGAGNKLPGTKNEASSFLVTLEGAHAHTIVGAALSEAQLGSHAHVTGPYRAYGATYGGGAPHAHTSYGPWRPGSGGISHDSSVEADAGVNVNTRTHTTGTDGHHDHPAYVDIHVATDYRGSGHTHTHGCESKGAHQHTVTSTQIRDNLPYYALAYIMKL